MAASRATTEAASWLANLTDASIVAGRPGPVSAVCHDSRRVVAGALFVAIPGYETDGHRYLADALQRGATALLVQADRKALWEPQVRETDVAVITAPDTRRALAQAAAGFFGHPATKLGVIGVTGTDGKTTTVHLIAHLLESAERSAGFLSSVSFRAAGAAELNASHMTTLEAPDVQERLAEMVTAGRRYAVIEASSHGLALHRVDECAFDVAVFTMLSSDHLDFHGTAEAYREAKGRLFQMLDQSAVKDVPKAAVLNADDPATDYFRALTSAPVVTYGVEHAADVMAADTALDGLSLSFLLQGPGGRYPVRSSLAGRYNVYNCLAAAAVCLSQGVSMEQVVRGIETFPGVPGRLERIEAGQPYRVVVDIASTPEALRQVLAVLRSVTSGRLWAVFGCAGERDPGRRDGMGRVAGELADFVVLTNEDPRREDADAIIESIAGGLRQEGRDEERDFVRVPDRREALRYALQRAQPGDTVLLAGKGTEQSIITGDEHIPWDEAQTARELLRELGT